MVRGVVDDNPKVAGSVNLFPGEKRVPKFKHDITALLPKLTP